MLRVRQFSGFIKKEKGTSINAVISPGSNRKG